MDDDELVRLGRTIQWTVADANRLLRSMGPDVALLLQELRRRGKTAQSRAIMKKLSRAGIDLPGVVADVKKALSNEFLAEERVARTTGGGGATSASRVPPRTSSTRRSR